MASHLEIQDEQIIRRPAFSRQDINARLSVRSPEEVLQDPDISTYFSLSKPDLYKYFCDEIQKGATSSKLRKTIETYLIRMSTRPTPNKCMSGLGISGSAEYDTVKIIKLKRTEPSSAFSINKTIDFRKDYCTIRGKEDFKQFHLPGELISVLRALPRVFNFPSFQKSILAKKLNANQAKETFKKLIDIEVIVPSKKNSLFYPYKNNESGTESALLFSFKEPLIAKEHSRNIIEIGTELLEMRYFQRRRWATNSLWDATQTFLNKHFDHGPVPFINISEKYLHSIKTISFSTNPNQFDTFLSERAHSCSKDRIWVINDSEWEKLKALSGHQPLHLPAVSAITFTDENVNFKLLLGVTSNSATKAFSRFGDHDQAIASFIKKIHTHEKTYRIEKLSEIEIHPKDQSLDFLIRRHSYFDYCIELDASDIKKQTGLTISDLAFVKNTQNEWVLVTSDLKTTILPSFTHLVNPTFIKNFYYSLLHDYAQFRTPQAYVWYWGENLRNYSYLPRVERRGILLSLSKWRLKPPANLDSNFADYLNNLNPPLPNNVFLVDEDKRLPLRVSSSLFRQIVSERWAKGQSVSLEEDLSNEQELREVIIVGFDKPDLKALKPIIKLEEKAVSNFRNYRISLNPLKLNEFFKLIYSAFKLKLKKNELNFYFIVFHYPDYHIRFRLNSKTNQNKLLNQLSRAIDEDIIYSYSNHSYTPELDRWINPKGLSLFEKLSCLDSALTIKHMPLSVNDSLSLISFWISFFFKNKSDQISFLKSSLATMKVNQTTQVGILIKLVSNEEIKKIDLNPNAQHLMRQTRTFLNSLKINQRHYFVFNMLHLSLNRTGFIQQDSEEKAVYQRILKSLMSNL